MPPFNYYQANEGTINVPFTFLLLLTSFQAPALTASAPRFYEADSLAINSTSIYYSDVELGLKRHLLEDLLVLKSFSERLSEQSLELPDDMALALEEHFWELL